jgi:hypothetical protein
MTCARCGATYDGKRWCADCEVAYDGWVRQYATDMIAPVLGAMVVVLVCAMALPIAGVSTLVAVCGAFGGFATLGGMTRLNIRRRRRQFLQTRLPRAYLPPPQRDS